MLKVKHQRTADCVVAGLPATTRTAASARCCSVSTTTPACCTTSVWPAASPRPCARSWRPSSCPTGTRRSVGHPWRDLGREAGGSRPERRVGQRRPGAQSRWNAGKDLSWEPVRIELVAEVAYEHLQGDRFRHTARFVRWRPDREPGVVHLRPARRARPRGAARGLRRLVVGLPVANTPRLPPQNLGPPPAPPTRPVPLNVPGPPKVLPSAPSPSRRSRPSPVSSGGGGGDFGGAPATPAAVSVDASPARAFRSERFTRVAGSRSGISSTRSRFLPAANGWIRLHANYPWHRARLLSVLGTSDDPDAVARAVARWPALVLEDAIAGAGGCAAAVRTLGEWLAHEQGYAVHALPLLELERIGDGPLTLPATAIATAPSAPLRVLDLTRVIAGPVCTRTLARMVPTCCGSTARRCRRSRCRRSTRRRASARRSSISATPPAAPRSKGCSADADVVVTGYRPGALDRFGLDPESLARRRPGIVVVTLSAWVIPARGHRGVVSTASCRRRRGSRGVEAGGERVPGVLPAQVLDHATGYLAAGRLRRCAVAPRRAAAGTCLSLAQDRRRGSECVRRPAGRRSSRQSSRGAGRGAVRSTCPSSSSSPGPARAITLVGPPGAVGGRAGLARRPRVFGADPPAWW